MTENKNEYFIGINQRLAAAHFSKYTIDIHFITPVAVIAGTSVINITPIYFLFLE